jgi:hypothetical protein
VVFQEIQGTDPMGEPAGAKIRPMKRPRSRPAAVGAGVYLLAFAVASLYPLFDQKTFSGLLAVLLAWPWIDYLPRWHFSIVLAVALNAMTIYLLLALLSLGWPSREM